MKKKRIYISGPMTKLPREKYMKRFAVAEKILRAHGFDVINPTKVWACRWPWLYKIVGYKLTLLYDLWLLLTKADGIINLPGWHTSRGSVIENNISQWFYMCGISEKVREEINEAVNKI